MRVTKNVSGLAARSAGFAMCIGRPDAAPASVLGGSHCDGNRHAGARMIHTRVARLRVGLVIVPLLGAMILGAALRQTDAQEIGDAAAGQQLAEGWCISCHVVSRTPERGVSNGAPTFAAIARLKSTTPLALRAFLQTPHARMPDLHLTRDEIDNLAAYILSPRHK
jgi:mono/diheme cytochrome c family protein